MTDKINLVPLKGIDYKDEFYCGTVLRKYNVGMNPDIINKNDNFYDYLLVYLNWEENMVLVNVTENSSKKGYGYSGTIPVNTSSGNFTVNRKGFEFSFGKDLEDWFLLK
ncbi:hypothetical protein Q4566_16665 [Tamlana sp. 2_MG-2023]|uniref:hypothetical protein n=1 Tax=unclassified Tamlana TaxID=2614803 RepID=UPI0026E2A452|nr:MULTISPECIES: hypothetical protein [unclassified Tamlana]MDO6761841.1 hypothetical protein [Tamlana sp. 2_MG-2023]MDO6792614.1 hypothetical protein [Tamlana sp. 1_MG-2023]